MKKRKIKFEGIDAWNRPVFKVIEKKYYISDLENLFSFDVSKKEIKEFYNNKKLSNILTYHGTYFDSEPMGNKLKDINFQIV